MKTIYVVARVLLMAALFPSFSFASEPLYRVTGSIPVPGPVRWDTLTLDEKSHRLYIAHGDRVDVLNLASGKLAGSIKNIDGPHGTALAIDLNHGFISDGNSGSVDVFNLKTLRRTNTIAVGEKPDAIIYDTGSRRVFVANADSHDISVIDAAHNQVISAIALDGEPEFMVADKQGHLYINLVDVAQIALVNIQSLRIEKRYDLASVCSEPTGLALDERRHRLFASCRNNVMVILATESGEKLATLAIGSRTDGAAYDPILDRTFSSNGDGTLTVIGHSEDDHYFGAQVLKTLPGARTLAIDTSHHRIYLAAAAVDSASPKSVESSTQRFRYKPDSFRVIVVERSKSLSEK